MREPQATQEPLDATTLRSLPELARLVETRFGKPVDYSTLWRWAVKGLPSGIKLETRRIGLRWYSSLANVDRFFHAIATTRPTAKPPAPAGQSIEQGVS